MSALRQAGYAMRRRLLAWLRWPTVGVKVMVFDAEGRLLLIRNAYGDGAAWVLPGGGVHWRESPSSAAAREVIEETACRISEVVLLGVYGSRQEGKRDTVHLFRATTGDVPIADPREVAEARFFALDALPGAESPATRRRIDELMGIRLGDGVW